MAAAVSSPSATSRIDLALLVLRVVIGIVFLMHGGQKLFVYGFGGVIGAFTKMGVPAPVIFGPLITIIEFVGGLALVAGLVTRIAGFLLACDMLGAILLVHLKNGFFAGGGGFELPLSLLAAAAALLFAGAGGYSVDGVLARKRAG